MKRVLPIILIFVLVIAGAAFLYPRLREKAGDPEIDFGSGGAAVAVVTTTEAETTAPETTAPETTPAGTTDEADPDNGDATGSTTPPTTTPATTPAPETLTAPDFKVYDLEGTAVQYVDITDGKPVLINFWASWCPPCREEMPDLQRLHDELGDEIDFLLINSTDGVRETPDKARDFLDEHGFDMPVYLDQDGEASIIYGVNALPTNIIIGADGEIIGGISGALTEEQFREIFEKYLDIV